MLQRRHLQVVLGLAACFSLGSANAAASQLLETVKQNKQLATQNAHDPAAIQATAAQQGLSPLDAEILTTYVVGMYCPDVR